PYLVTQSVTTYAQRDDAQIYAVSRQSGTTTYEIANDGSTPVLDFVKSIQSNSATRNVVSQALSFYDGNPFEGLPFGQIGNYAALVRMESLVLTPEILQAAYGANVPPYFSAGRSPTWTNDYPQEFRDLLPASAGHTYQPGENGSPYQTGYYSST